MKSDIDSSKKRKFPSADDNKLAKGKKFAKIDNNKKIERNKSKFEKSKDAITNAEGAKKEKIVKEKIEAADTTSVKNETTTQPNRVKRAPTEPKKVVDLGPVKHILDDSAKKALQQNAKKDASLARGVASDPSLKYYFTPLDTPIIHEAKEYFAGLSAEKFCPLIRGWTAKIGKPAVNTKVPKFNVFMNAQSNWRSHAKLAVRNYVAGVKATPTMDKDKKNDIPSFVVKKEEEDEKDKYDDDSSSSSSSSDSSSDSSDSDDDIDDETMKDVKTNKSTQPIILTEDILAQIKELESKKRLTRTDRKKLNQLKLGNASYVRPDMGIFLPNSHDIAPGIETCPAHHGSINRAIHAVQRAVQSSKTVGFNDTNGDGFLRYIVVTSATQAAKQELVSKIQLTLVWNSAGSDKEKPQSFDTPKFAKKYPDGDEGLAYIKKHHPELSKLVAELLVDNKKKTKGAQHSLWHSIHVHYNNSWSHTNNIFTYDTNAWQRLYGEECIQEILPVKPHPALVDDAYNSGRLGFAEVVAPKKKVEASDASASAPPANKKVVILKKASAPIPAVSTPVPEEESGGKKEHAKIVLARPTLSFPPTVFRQANLEGFTKIITNARLFIPQDSHVVELYGGVGTIGLNVLDRCASLVCSDENPNNYQAFAAALDTVKPEVRQGRAVKYLPKGANAMVEQGALKNSQFLSSEVYDEELWRSTTAAKRAKMEGTPLPAPSVCLVDPPRKGLDESVLGALAAPKKDAYTPNGSSLDRLIYISCGFKALQRDCDRLTSAAGGNWRIQHAEGHVLFPGADHIETLVVFVR